MPGGKVRSYGVKRRAGGMGRKPKFTQKIGTPLMSKRTLPRPGGARRR